MVFVEHFSHPCRGFYVLPFWSLSGKIRVKFSQVDLWVPDLSPNFQELNNYKSGGMDWNEFGSKYLEKLNKQSIQNLIRPLALLSLRKNVVLLCGCHLKKHCISLLLAEAIRECSSQKSFGLLL